MFSKIIVFGIIILFILTGSVLAITDTKDFVSILDGCVWETGEGTGIGDDGKKIVNSAFLVGGEENDNPTHANSMVRGFVQFDISSMMSNNPTLITTATLIVSIDRVFNRIDLGPMPFYIANVDFGNTIDGSDWEMTAQFGQENIANVEGIDRLLGATDQLGYADVVVAVISNVANSISNVSLRINPTGIYDSIRRDEIQVFSGACILRVTYEYIISGPPSIPANFIASKWTNNYDVSLLTWDDSDIETSYTLFRSTTPSTSSALPLSGINNNITSYTDMGLSTNTTYYYWIKAYNINGSDGFSAMASNVIPVIGIPSSPVLMTPVESGTNIFIEWNDVANETSYTLYMSTNNFTTTNTATPFPRNITNHYYGPFGQQITYYFKVKANNMTGNSSDSIIESISFSSFKVHNRTRGIDYSTISAALAGAMSGELIEVDPAVYNEVLSFDVSSITLRATAWTQNWDNTNTIINAAGNPVGVSIIDDDDIVLQGFTIKNAASSGIFIDETCLGIEIRNCNIISNAIGIDNDANTSLELLVFSNIIAHNGSRGFYTDKQGTQVIISNNLFISNNGDGLALFGQGFKVSGNIIFGNNGGGIDNRRGNEISDNIIYKNNTEGIYLYNASGAQIKGNKIYNHNSGIRCTDNSNYLVKNSIITNNIIFSNTTGILMYGYNNKITGNTIYDNSTEGIYSLNITNTVISYNTIYGHNDSGDSGIKITNSISDNVMYNTLYDNYTGIDFHDSQGGLIELNTIRDHTGWGILISGSASPEILKNNIISNSINLENSTSLLLIVTNNWWGSTIVSDIETGIIGGTGGYNASNYRLFGPFDITEGADTERLPAITAITTESVTVPFGIEVTWNKPSDNTGFSRYFVYRSLIPGTTNLSAANIITQFNDINNTNFIDTGVSGGNQYYYHITSLDDHPVYTNESWYSIEASHFFQLLGPPETLNVDLNIYPVTNAILTWNNSFNAYGYEISTNKSDIFVTRSTNLTIWTDNSVVYGQTITYYIRATNSIEKSSWVSNTVSIVIDPYTLNDDLLIQYYDGNEWQTTGVFAFQTDMSNDVFYSNKVFIDDIINTSPTNINIRFVSDCSDVDDDMYVDQIEVHVFRTNLNPVAITNSYSVDMNDTLSISAPGVLSNDIEYEGDPLICLLANNVTHGTMTLNSDGSFDYTPDPGYFGIDSFTYTANDGIEDSNIVEVRITVNLTVFPGITINNINNNDIFKNCVIPNITIMNSTGSWTNLNGSTYNGQPICTNGVYILHVIATNPIGKITNSVSFKIDLIAPVITMDGIWSNDCFPAGTRVNYGMIDANPYSNWALLNGSDYISGTPISEGTYTLEIYAQDVVNNMRTNIYNFCIYNTYPVIEITAAGVPTINKPALSGYMVKLSGSSTGGDTQSEGSDTVNESLMMMPLKKDMTNFFNPGVEIDIEIINADMESVIRKLNGIDCPSRFVINEIGYYEIYVECNDEAGNNSKFDKAIILIDDVKPVIKVDSSGINCRMLEIEISDDFLDIGSIDINEIMDRREYESKIEVKEISKNRVVYNLILIGNRRGKYNMSVSASDKSGNKQEFNSPTYMVNAVTANVIKELSVKAGESYTNDVVLNLEMANCAISSLIELNGKEIGIEELPVVLSKDNEYNLHVEAEYFDMESGIRKVEDENVNFCIDRKAPVVEIDGVEDRNIYSSADIEVKVFEDNLATNSKVVYDGNNYELEEIDSAGKDGPDWKLNITGITDIGFHGLEYDVNDRAGWNDNGSIRFGIYPAFMASNISFIATYDNGLDADYAILDEKNYGSKEVYTDGYVIIEAKEEGIKTGLLYTNGMVINPKQGTISLLIKPEWKDIGKGEERYILSVRDDGIGNNGGCEFNNNKALINIKVKGKQGNNDQTIFQLGMIKDDKEGITGEKIILAGNRWFESEEWTHIIFKWDFNKKKMVCYINNEKAGEQVISGQELYNIGKWIIIGSPFQTAGENNVFNGKLDDIKIFNRALTEPECRNLELKENK